MSLPILLPRLPAQRYSCHGCGNCCRDFTVQLRPEDLDKLEAQEWQRRLGEPVTVTFRERTYLRQRSDGACIFLQEGGRCRIHAEYGLEAKPLACQMFPFSLAPAERGVAVGLNFACQSVLENKGAALSSHVPDIARLAALVPEAAPTGRPPLLTPRLRASDAEAAALVAVLDGWMARAEVPIDVRLEGLAWLAQSLWSARLDRVREERFVELLSTLAMALPDELEHLPTEPPASRHWRLLRQAVHARTEDLRLAEVVRRARWRIVLEQLRTSRRFARGRGTVPSIGDAGPNGATFAAVAQAGAAADGADAEAVADLLTRYVRATILGGRFFGGGYYGWPLAHGVAAIALNASATSWLSRLYAVGAGRGRIELADVQAALGRIDRHSGRAAWLGSAGERWRLTYLVRTDGLRRMARHVPFCVGFAGWR
ncbi:MAG: YkgJ family cysteine cluster protein [Phycisphaerales bacterium]|nr:YkgJ family cysteine cluster protein [Phycisphaerales bacterium]